MKTLLDYIKTFSVFTIAIFAIVFLVHLNEEEPHNIIINGKEYTRLKEYTGNGTYQVILIPVDTTQLK